MMHAAVAYGILEVRVKLKFLSAPWICTGGLDVHVTAIWRVLRLRMEERPVDMEGSCEYFE